MNAGAEEPLIFECQGSTLVGILHRPATARRGVAVLVIVGGPQYRVGSHRQFVSSARSIAAAGYPVLRFDYRGMGDSDGEFAGFECVSDDIRSAIDALCSACHPPRGVVLLGLCDAASAALMYCSSDTRVAGLILMNPWVRTGHSQAAVIVKRYYVTRFLQADFWRKLVSGGFDFFGSTASLARNVLRAAKRPGAAEATEFIGVMRAGFEQFSAPVLIVQSGRDLTADEFRALCRDGAGWQRALARDTVQVVDMVQADHTFSRMSDLEEFNGHCKRWLDGNFGDAGCR